VDDSLPVVQNLGMRVQEGVRKTITEFELKAVDADTEAESVTFTIVQPPRHGTIERASRGQHFRHTSIFTMEDIYQKRVSYSHDGSNSLRDRFTFTVADGTNPFFIVEEGGKEVRGTDSGEGGAVCQRLSRSRTGHFSAKNSIVFILSLIGHKLVNFSKPQLFICKMGTVTITSFS